MHYEDGSLGERCPTAYSMAGGDAVVDRGNGGADDFG